jgi:pyridinium-3,5-bisthiocarboxylic acid mononucleotide nickel chelatase
VRILYFDCFSGASGDMLLGALIDAGVRFEDVRDALGSLAVAPDSVWVERVTRAGVGATKFHVQGEALPIDRAHDHEHEDHDPHERLHGERPHSHDHDHHHPHSHRHEHAHESRSHHFAHRPLTDIYRLIDTSSLSHAGKDQAKGLFHRLGEAEAAIHGASLDKVHLHEVGALDSIIDIVGTVFALERLGADRVVSSALNVGGGMIRSAHGLYPVPAPATARLLQGAPIYAGAQDAELVTPTGALLVTGYATAYGPVPPMRLEKIGYGAGTRDFADTPNVLRVLLGEADGSARSETVTVIEAEIDDMNPQIFGLVMDRLLAEGALDVYYTSIQMKKNRPGTLLTVLARPDSRERLTAVVFQETTTIGVRYRDMTRECLERETVTVDTPLGPVRVKIARRDGEVMNVAPEFDDCARIASATGRPLKEVQAAAMKAYSDTQ